MPLQASGPREDEVSSLPHQVVSCVFIFCEGRRGRARVYLGRLENPKVAVFSGSSLLARSFSILL